MHALSAAVSSKISRCSIPGSHFDVVTRLTMTITGLVQELLAGQRGGGAGAPGQRQLDVGDLRGDPDLERLHRDRLAELQQEQEKRQKLQRRGHGEYQVRGRQVENLVLIVSL